MSNGGYLAPPDQNPEQKELWTETWTRLDRFLPNFFTELFPKEAKEPPLARKLVADEQGLASGEAATGEGKADSQEG